MPTRCELDKQRIVGALPQPTSQNVFGKRRGLVITQKSFIPKKLESVYMPIRETEICRLIMSVRRKINPLGVWVPVNPECSVLYTGFVFVKSDEHTCWAWKYHLL